jgi:hypothetical protein
MSPLTGAIGAAVAIACLSLSQVATAQDSTALDTVATTALQAVIDSHDCRERAGAIILSPDGYHATVPTVGREDDFTLRIQLHRGEKLAALYHTHTACGAEGTAASAGLFSAPDVATAQQLHVPSYIGVAVSHEVRKYDPATMPTQINVGSRGARASGQIASGVRVAAPAALQLLTTRFK